MAAKRLINQRGWLLSHTMHCNTAKNRENRFENGLEGLTRAIFLRADTDLIGALPIRVTVFRLFLRKRQRFVEQNESGSRDGCSQSRQMWAAALSPRHCEQAKQSRPQQEDRWIASSLTLLAKTPSRAQVASGFGFLDLRDLVLTGLREVDGLMRSGLPPATGVTSGPGLKNALQPGLRCDLFLITQTVTRSTSGISELQRPNASPLPVCRCSGVEGPLGVACSETP